MNNGEAEKTILSFIKPILDQRLRFEDVDRSIYRTLTKRVVTKVLEKRKIENPRDIKQLRLEK